MESTYATQGRSIECVEESKCRFESEDMKRIWTRDIKKKGREKIYIMMKKSMVEIQKMCRFKVFTITLLNILVTEKMVVVYRRPWISFERTEFEWKIKTTNYWGKCRYRREKNKKEIFTLIEYEKIAHSKINRCRNSRQLCINEINSTGTPHHITLPTLYPAAIDNKDRGLPFAFTTGSPS